MYVGHLLHSKSWNTVLRLTCAAKKDEPTAGGVEICDTAHWRGKATRSYLYAGPIDVTAMGQGAEVVG
jgi:hypothetical protein